MKKYLISAAILGISVAVLADLQNVHNGSAWSTTPLAAGGSGTVVTSTSGVTAGTVNTLSKYTAGTTVGNSSVTDDGATVAVPNGKFTVGTATLSVTGGNVGIGTTVPASNLDVQGTANFSQGITLGSTPPGYVTTSSFFQLGVGGSTPFLMNPTSGYFNTTLFGIGTTSPLASLHVVGDSVLGTAILSNGAAGTNPTLERYLVSGTSKLLIGAASGNNNFGVGITTGDGFMVTPTTSNGIGFYSGQSIATGPNLFVKTSNLDPRVGVGTTSPSYRLQISSGAGEGGSLMAVSTGAVDVFRVTGTSVVLSVPLNMNSQPIQNAGTISGNGTGRISLVDTANSSMSFVSSGGTHTMTTQGFVTSAATAEIGNTSNLIALQLGASSATFNQNMISTGTITGKNFVDSTSGFTIDHATMVWSAAISSVTASMSIDIGPLSAQSQATITKIEATALPVGTTAQFQLDSRTLANIASAGTNVFSVTSATATSPGASYTSFSAPAIAQGNHLVLTTPATNSQAGGVTCFGLTIYYKEQ